MDGVVFEAGDNRIAHGLEENLWYVCVYGCVCACVCGEMELNQWQCIYICFANSFGILRIRTSIALFINFVSNEDGS